MPNLPKTQQMIDNSIAAVSTIIEGDLTLADTKNIIVSATTGSQIATAATQKLGFYGATPITQPASAAQAAVSATQQALTDNSTGAASTTLAAITDEPTANAVASLAHQLALAKADIASLIVLANALRLALVNEGLVKGAA